MEIGLQLHLGPGAPDSELDDVTRALRDELAATPVHRVELGTELAAPELTKGFGLVALGSLILAFLDAGGLSQVVDVLSAWLQRDAHRTVTMTDGQRTIEVAGLSAKDQRELITRWLSATAAEEGGSDG